MAPNRQIDNSLLYHSSNHDLFPRLFREWNGWNGSNIGRSHATRIGLNVVSIAFHSSSRFYYDYYRYEGRGKGLWRMLRAIQFPRFTRPCKLPQILNISFHISWYEKITLTHSVRISLMKFPLFSDKLFNFTYENSVCTIEIIRERYEWHKTIYQKYKYKLQRVHLRWNNIFPRIIFPLGK